MEELVAFLSHFQDLTDIVSTKVTSLSLIQLIRREIEDISATSSTNCEEIVALIEEPSCRKFEQKATAY